MSHVGGSEEKVILNGGSAGAILTGNALLLKEVCTRIYRHVDEGKHFPDVLKLVVLANEIEKVSLDLQQMIFRFQREYLEQVGFEGPWPNSMEST